MVTAISILWGFAVFAAMVWSWREPAVALDLGRCVALLLFGAFVVQAVTGVLRAMGAGPEGLAMAHFRMTHFVFAWGWAALPMVVAADLGRSARLKRSLVAVIRSAAAVAFLCLWWTAALTGYLGPASDPGLSPSNLWRFRLLHEAAVPGLFLLIFGCWWLGFRLDRPHEPATTSGDSPVGGGSVPRPVP